jgi:hypothetical protein
MVLPAGDTNIQDAFVVCTTCHDQHDMVAVKGMVGSIGGIVVEAEGSQGKNQLGSSIGWVVGSAVFPYPYKRIACAAISTRELSVSVNC